MLFGVSSEILVAGKTNCCHVRLIDTGAFVPPAIEVTTLQMTPRWINVAISLGLIIEDFATILTRYLPVMVVTPTDILGEYGVQNINADFHNTCCANLLMINLDPHQYMGAFNPLISLCSFPHIGQMINTFIAYYSLAGLG